MSTPADGQLTTRRSTNTTTLQRIALGGLALAAIATLLPWVRGGSVSCSAWSDRCGGNVDTALLLSRWLGTNAPLDAALIILLVGAGASLIIRGQPQAGLVANPLVPVACGTMITLVGLLNYVDLENQLGSVRDILLGDSLGIGIGVGVYFAMLGGFVGAVCSFLNLRQPPFSKD